MTNRNGGMRCAFPPYTATLLHARQQCCARAGRAQSSISGPTGILVYQVRQIQAAAPFCTESIIQPTVRLVGQGLQAGFRMHRQLLENPHFGHQYASHLVQTRIDDLYVAVVDGRESQLVAVESHIEDLTRVRHRSPPGQIVLRALEEKAWWLVVAFVPQTDQVRCLSQITGIIGAGKDQLAQIYLQHLEKAEVKAASLQGRLDGLAKGTDSGPVFEDDLSPGFVREW